MRFFFTLVLSVLILTAILFLIKKTQPTLTERYTQEQFSIYKCYHNLTQLSSNQSLTTLKHYGQ